MQTEITTNRPDEARRPSPRRRRPTGDARATEFDEFFGKIPHPSRAFTFLYVISGSFALTDHSLAQAWNDTAGRWRFPVRRGDF